MKINRSISSFLLLITLVITSGCSSLNSKSSDFKVTYVKSKGRIATAAHFTIKLEATSVHYNGIANMPVLGEHNFKIQKSELKKIKAAFDKSNFSSFDSLYQGNVRDLPISSIIYKNHEVRFQTTPAPQELKDLATMLENILAHLKN